MIPARRDMQAILEQSRVPLCRVRNGNERPVDREGEFILYWMVANRRTRWNFSLERAADWARALNKPLLVFEALRAGYRWASDRLHWFVIQGMADNARRLNERKAYYYPYLEPAHGAGRGLLEQLAANACVVVTDDFPAFFLPRMLSAVADRIPVRLELVDSNGLLPMRAADQTYSRAHYFRRFLQKTLPFHLLHFPRPDPLARLKLPTLNQLPNALPTNWPPADVTALATDPQCLAGFEIDHTVGTVETPGGAVAAERLLQSFLAHRLHRYEQHRNDPDIEATSGLSPYLHFGHISTHQVFHDVTQQDGWSADLLRDKPNGSREGWWGASPAVESFLDELITWRELGFNMCWQQSDYDTYESLPEWARQTLADHERDHREFTYSLAEFERAETHDELWNAAQRQLFREGRIHNYLRMLWGKKILHWTDRPREALEIMIELNNKYALDGRDPNSYSGIFWVLGRYDRPWGPERKVFGKVRYMTSDNTRRKLKLSTYLERYGQ